MRIVCITTGERQGSGTLTGGLAAAFARRGQSVLMLDPDLRTSLTRSFGEPERALALRMFTLPAASEKRRPLTVEEMTTAWTRIALAPSWRSAPSHAPLPNLGHALLRAFTDDAVPYDHVLFDCPSAFRGLALSALAAADLALLPTGAEPTALHALEHTVRTVAMVARTRGASLPALIVPTASGQSLWNADKLATLRGHASCAVWHTPVHTDAAAVRAALHDDADYAALSAWIAPEPARQIDRAA